MDDGAAVVPLGPVLASPTFGVLVHRNRCREKRDCQR